MLWGFVKLILSFILNKHDQTAAINLGYQNWGKYEMEK